MMLWSNNAQKFIEISSKYKFHHTLLKKGLKVYCFKTHNISFHHIDIIHLLVLILILKNIFKFFVTKHTLTQFCIS